MKSTKHRGKIKLGHCADLSPHARGKSALCDSHVVTSQVASSHSPTLTLAFWECKCLLRCGVEKASAEDVIQVLHLTCRMVAAAAMERNLSCSEMAFAGLFARGGPLCRNLPYDDLLFGEALLFGDALPLADALLLSDARLLNDARHFDDDGPVFDHVLIPHSVFSEALLRTSRVVRAVCSEFSRVLCCWSWRHWVGYS